MKNKKKNKTPNKYDWDSVDWNKSNEEIRLEIGASYNLVSSHRQTHAPHTSHNGYQNIDWDKIEWGKTNVVISEELGCSMQYVVDKRRFLFPECFIVRKGMPNWESINWQKNNKEIASVLGYSMSYIHRRRRKYASQTIPKKSKKKKVIREATGLFFCFFDWDSVDWSKSNMDLASSIGCPCGSVNYYRHKSNNGQKLINKSKIDWAKIDWAKSRLILAQEIGCSCGLVSYYRELYAPDTMGQERIGGVVKYDWDSVDWSKRTKNIARELGVRDSYVSEKRNKYAPKTVGIFTGGRYKRDHC